MVMLDRHRDTFQPRVPGALPGHASNPTPGVPCTEASQTPTVGDSDPSLLGGAASLERHRAGQKGTPPVDGESIARNCAA